MDSYPSQVVLVRFICFIYRAVWLTRIKPVVIKQQTKKIYCLPARIGTKGWVLWTYTVVQVTNIKLPSNAGTLCAITTRDEDIRMVSFYCMDRTRGAKYVRPVQKRVKKGHEAYGQSCYTDWLDQKIPLGHSKVSAPNWMILLRGHVDGEQDCSLSVCYDWVLLFTSKKWSLLRVLWMVTVCE